MKDEIKSWFHNSNNKDQQVVADRLVNVHKDNVHNADSTTSMNIYYAILGTVIGIFCLLLGFILLPDLLNNFPLGLLSSYPINIKNSLLIIVISLLAGVGSASYAFYRQHGFSKMHYAANTLTKDDMDDATIDLPADLPRKYNIAPDEKVHADIDVTALLSHINIKSSHAVHGKDGKVHFDNKFGNELFDTASLPNDKKIRIFYDAAKLAYNPSNEYGKPRFKTVKDYINNNWYVPEYEDGTQDPAGAYIVSTSPENTVVVSETRGGKGIKYIEPILDLWSREKHQPNLVITDLKMELMRMYLRTFTLRGYNVKSLNLMEPSQTDAINFIGYAVEAAIRGDITQMEKEVSAVSDIFFVNKGNQDPMWNNAAAATFKRTIYILINYYNERVKMLKEDSNLTAEEISQKSDEAWGHVTLYNAYKFTVELASKSYPKSIYEDMYPKDQDGNTTDPDPESETKSALSLYCDAIGLLPTNAIRSKIADQNKAIATSAKSEKTLSSIYSVCMFGMIFFTDNTIIKLTSARPSANLDLKGFAFPRRIGVSFNRQFTNRFNLIQAVTVWQAYHDPEMKDPYPEDEFRYEGNVDDFCWATAYFKGKFDDNKPTYLKLTIYSRTGYKSKSPLNLKLKEFDFVFRKNYRKSYSGRQYLINPITGQREVQGGEMHEFTYDPRTKKVHQIRSGIDTREHSLLFSDKGAIQTKTRYTIESYDIHYADKPTALFLVTSEPSYNKVLLMTLNNLYDQQVALCKIAVGNQKPIVPTKYMLDEFGNIKSEGKGVPKLDEKLSSGLGFGQQFTLILQSLSQLTSLYDNAVKNTLIANSANFFFMKSKDKEMIHQLMDMNGKIHIPVRSSVTMQDNRGKSSNFFGDPKKSSPHQGPSISFSREERPLLDENAYLKLNEKASDGNAIVSRGSSTIVSIRDTIMPVSFKLLANNLGNHGDMDKGAPSSLPTMSDINNFSPLQNVPDFDKMTAEAIEEAKMAPKVIEQFKKVEHKTDHDIMLMDQELYSDRIMAGIRANLKAKKSNNSTSDLNKIMMNGNERSDDERFNSKFNDLPMELQSSYTNKALKQGDNAAEFAARHAQSLREHILAKKNKAINNSKNRSLLERMRETARPNKDFDLEGTKQQQKYWNTKIYADHRLSRLDLMTPEGIPTGQYDDVLSMAFANCFSYFNTDPNFILVQTDQGTALQMANQQPAIDVATVDTGESLSDSLKYIVRPAFIKYLTKLDSWEQVANGRFEVAVINALNEKVAPK